MVLGWTINIVKVRNDERVESRMLRTFMRTLVSFVATDREKTVSFGDVIK